MGSDGRKAAAADHGHADTLGLDPAARLGVVGSGDELLLADPNLDRERALAGLREHFAGLEPEADLGSEAEPVEPAGGEHDGVESPLAALAQTRVDVSAQRLDRQLRLEREQLCAPPHRGGADPHPGPQLGGAAKRVARVFARQVRADRKAVGVGRGHVLRRVHGSVDAVGEQRLFELLDEHAALTDLAERAAPVAVACGCDRDERDLPPRAAEMVGRE